MVIDIVIAALMDLIFGDPEWLPHPVKLIGKLVNLLKRLLLHNDSDKKRSKVKETAGGIIILIITSAVTAGLVALILFAAKAVNDILFHILNILILYTSLAGKNMADEALKVVRVLDKEGLDNGRKQVARIVGRDTSELNSNQVLKAAIESTAENTVDGVLSPVFYIIVGAFIGCPAVLVYIFKAVSTLDSMIGYRNDRYKWFGTASARTDDVLNFIPARLSGFLIPLSALLIGRDHRNSLRIFIRDRKKHESPNSAHSEAAIAGALNIMLGGTSTYSGDVVNHPLIGDPQKVIEPGDVRSAVLIMLVSALILLMLGIAILITVYGSGAVLW